MKSYKNLLHTLALVAAALSLIIALFTILFDTEKFALSNTYLMIAMLVFAAFITEIYVILIIKRINPKQYIYVSSTQADSETVECIVQMLEEELKKASKYRFEILTPNSIPFGSDIQKTMSEYLEKSNIVFVIVSENYLMSERCNREFITISAMKKKIIPIVTESYSQLSQLSHNISNIKSLSISDCKTPEDFANKMHILALDLIKQRYD